MSKQKKFQIIGEVFGGRTKSAIAILPGCELAKIDLADGVAVVTVFPPQKEFVNAALRPYWNFPSGLAESLKPVLGREILRVTAEGIFSKNYDGRRYFEGILALCIPAYLSQQEQRTHGISHWFIGDPLTQVFAIEGPPDRYLDFNDRGFTCHWDAAFVNFNTEHKAVGYHSRDSRVLKTKFVPEVAATANRQWSIGSSMSEVLSIEGTPIIYTNRADGGLTLYWGTLNHFGTGYSWVVFRDDQVVVYKVQDAPLKGAPTVHDKAGRQRVSPAV